MKKVLIVGCGAIGSLFAAHLAKGGEVEVYAFDVSQPHVDAINRNGLRLSGASDIHARLMKASTDPSVLPVCDYGIVATKAIHTASAIDSCGALLRRQQRRMLGAEWSGQRRDHRRTREVCDPGNDLSRRSRGRARTRGLRYQRRHLGRTVRTHAHADACEWMNSPASSSAAG